jgi:hypothetical protein
LASTHSSAVVAELSSTTPAAGRLAATWPAMKLPSDWPWTTIRDGATPIVPLR